RGMQFTGMTDDDPVDEQFGAAAGMPGQVLRGAALEAHPGGTCHGLSGGEGVEGIGGATRAPRPGRLAQTGEHTTDVDGLLRQRPFEQGDLVVGGTTVDRERVDRLGLGSGLHDLRDRVERQVALAARDVAAERSEEHTSELQSRENLVCRLLLEKKKKKKAQV